MSICSNDCEAGWPPSCSCRAVVTAERGYFSFLSTRDGEQRDIDCATSYATEYRCEVSKSSGEVEISQKRSFVRENRRRPSRGRLCARVSLKTVSCDLSISHTFDAF